MFWSIVRFEIRYHVRNPLFYITSALFLMLAFGAVTSDTVQVGEAMGNVDRNAPVVILRLLGTLSVIGLFLVTAFVASSIHRDFELGTHALFFSRPVGKLRLLGGRFLGSMIVSVAVFAGPIVGIIVGSLMPWLDPERIGPFSPMPYLWSMLVLVVPNLLFMGATFFTIAALTRSMLATYVGVIATFVAYGVSQVFLGDLPSQLWAALLDPFGIAAVRVQTRYWTLAERNAALPELGGLLLANRLLWVALGLAVLAFCIWWFDPARAARPRRAAATQPDGPGVVVTSRTSSAARPTLDDRPTSQLRMLAHQLRLEVVTILRGAPFLVILLFSIINVVLSIDFEERMFGTRVVPVTRLMLEMLDGSYLFMLMIVVVFYAGEAIWRERSLSLAEIHDALPAPSWVFMAAKAGALGSVILIFAAAGALSTAAYQLAHGYTRLEPGLYAEGLLLKLIPFALCAVFAVVVQVMAGSKFLGYLVMIVYLLADDVYEALDMSHNLYRFPFLPDIPYSDMNGWGHFLEPYLWFALYWGFLCVVLLTIAALFWVRGAETAWRTRLRLARQRVTAPARIALATGLLGFVAVGAFIFYNTNILNEYLPENAQQDRQADYEKLYRSNRDLPQPKITEVAADVDIYPDERRLEVRGRYVLVNTTGSPISDLHLSMTPEATLERLELPPHRVTLEDARLGYRIISLDQPLAPGASLSMAFELTVDNPGFVNNDSDVRLVRNGTFFSNRDYFPIVGYDPDSELTDRNARRKRGLEVYRPMAPFDDPIARRRSVLGSTADWIRFETTVSTSADQIAVAPGYLEREWVENGRRSFRYVMDAPILNFFSYSSAAYEVRRDRWHDVAIEIYFLPGHDRNVERMIESVKKTLEYCTAHFGPYQHRQLRILEFPLYRSFAQSFDNTVPYSEAMGFIARIDGEDDIDTVFYVTAHEVAHQWWGHQVVGASVQGATMISESLAQYTALMVMEREYGRDTMRRFLKYELDRYLRGRGADLDGEKPLLRVENQPYIHYRKGSVVMYALRDYLGEETVNRALARYVAATRFQGPPYTASPDLRALLVEESPAGSARLFEDMLDTITLYSNRAESATFDRLDNGRYRVTLDVEAHKLRADGTGVETEIPLDDWVDIGVFGADDAVLFLDKRHLTDSRSRFEITVDGPPERAGIDPRNKLIDRDSDDNLTAVKPG